MEIGKIGNSEGGLKVKEDSGKYYWGIENDMGETIFWEEIPKELYDALVEYETEDKRSEG